MANEEVLKVFHAARQDIEIVWHQAGTIPHPIFDTQVAAMVLGYGDSIAYDQLVERVTGHRPDKTHRFTDWSRRPLTAEQMKYAVSDVTHLRDVFAALDADLKKRGRSDWVSEEMEVLTSPKTYDFHPERAWERLKTRVRKPKELAVLMEVAAWREQEAQSRDVPRSRVLKDDAVGDIATHAPTRSSGSPVCARCQKVLTGRNGAPISSPPCSAASPAILRRCRRSKSRAAIPMARRPSNS